MHNLRAPVPFPVSMSIIPESSFRSTPCVQNENSLCTTILAWKPFVGRKYFGRNRHVGGKRCSKVVYQLLAKVDKAFCMPGQFEQHVSTRICICK